MKEKKKVKERTRRQGDGDLQFSLHFFDKQIRERRKPSPERLGKRDALRMEKERTSSSPPGPKTGV